MPQARAKYQIFLLTKLMGAKQVSQMTMFDYVTGITVGSIAAELATELEEPVKPLTAMVVYGFVAALAEPRPPPCPPGGYCPAAAVRP